MYKFITNFNFIYLFFVFFIRHSYMRKPFSLYFFPFLTVLREPNITLIILLAYVGNLNVIIEYSPLQVKRFLHNDEYSPLQVKRFLHNDNNLL